MQIKTIVKTLVVVATFAYFTKKAFAKPMLYIDLTDKTKNATTSSGARIREKENVDKLFLMIHQTDGNQSAKALQFLNVKAQIGVPGVGPMVLIHPINSDVKGSYANTTSVEIAGKFPSGIKEGKFAGQAAKFDLTHKNKLTQDQIAGIKSAIDLFIDNGKREGKKASELQLIAHSQTYASRTFDPGLEPWHVASAYARLKGMTVDENYHIDSGIPIHKEWRI